jgi:hypothetical protein
MFKSLVKVRLANRLEYLLLKLTFFLIFAALIKEDKYFTLFIVRSIVFRIIMCKILYQKDFYRKPTL